jgi:hypothetical protein
MGFRCEDWNSGGFDIAGLSVRRFWEWCVRDSTDHPLCMQEGWFCIFRHTRHVFYTNKYGFPLQHPVAVFWNLSDHRTVFMYFLPAMQRVPAGFVGRLFVDH